MMTSRVNQLDASLLDEELEHMIVEPFWSSIVPISGSNDWRPEILAILRLFILKWSLERSQSYGSKLQNLRWTTGDKLKSKGKRGNSSLSQKQIAAYCILSVLPGYLLRGFRDYMIVHGWADFPSASNWSSFYSRDPLERRRYLRRAAWNTLERLSLVTSTIQLINFLIFLLNGRYRSLLERFLRIRLRYSQRGSFRNVSYEFLNRQLVWESVTDFVLFLLPLINVTRLRVHLRHARLKILNTLRNFFMTSTSSKALSGKQSKSLKEEDKKTGPYNSLPKDICPICKSQKEDLSNISSNIINPNDPTTLSNLSNPILSSININNSSIGNSNGGVNVGAILNQSDDLRVKIPYIVNCCGGLYCYYCLADCILRWRASSLDPRWECWRCGKEVTKISRWEGF
ncbi:Pex12 amino terminal region-domain-containing protein [Phakopsora pachyrhizi]|nr:Pex12 amino terminal region-domain-containing protein [Phakopsora pachyrhizi]